MRLSLRCVGGFTGPAGAQVRSVDTDTLPDAEADRLRALVRQLELENMPATLMKDRPQSSDFTYTLVVDDGALHQLRFHKDAGTPVLKELVDCLEKYPVV